MNTSLSTGREISLEINGVPLPAVDSYHVKATRLLRTVEGFGMQEVQSIAASFPRYTLELTRVCREEEASFYDLTGFSVSICRPGGRAVYTGCEWSDITENAGKDGVVTQTLRAAALSRIDLPE